MTLRAEGATCSTPPLEPREQKEKKVVVEMRTHTAGWPASDTNENKGSERRLIKGHLRNFEKRKNLKLAQGLTVFEV